MTKETYVKTVIKKIKCSGAKKKEIRQQLLSDIAAASENGETFDRIAARMGAPASIAAEFNENISAMELKKFKRGKNMKIGSLVSALLVLFILGIYWVLPKGAELEKGAVFNERMVKAQMKNVITWVEEEDYAQLREHSIPVLQSSFKGNAFSQAKAIISADWGKQVSYGNFYLTQLRQMGKKYAVGQVTVSYENTNVTYTLTFDEDLKLAGIYIK